ncbi:MAG: chemotaxis protein CheW [Firmicutes bacterium]|jgi:purine-binding chemotaxis protein CheW|nr:chemotaxis protein CheW [Bacillota bacterium]
MKDNNLKELDLLDNVSGEIKQFLTFEVEEEILGVDIDYVLDIIGVQRITEIPKQPEFIKGLINLRGKILPVMDIRLRFNKDYRPYDDRSCIIVMEYNENKIGVAVDRVLEVIKTNQELVSNPPENSREYNNNYLSGVYENNDTVTMILDCEKLFSFY